MISREQIINNCMEAQCDFIDFAKEINLQEEILNRTLRVLDSNKEAQLMLNGEKPEALN